MHKMNFEQGIKEDSKDMDKSNPSVVLLIAISVVLAWVFELFLVRAI